MVVSNSLTVQDALSFDDVLLEPGYSQKVPSQVSVRTQLGPFELNTPILSAAMDTVTESGTAIALALLGGLGVLHKNNLPEEQAREVRRVKKFQHAVIGQPVTIRKNQTIAEVLRVIEETGVNGFPVVDDNGVLVGMCTGRDIRYVDDLQVKVSTVMTSPVHSLAVGASQSEVVKFFREKKIEKCPLLDAQGRLKGLITSKDLRQAKDHPEAFRDTQGALRVGAAIGSGDAEIERAQILVASGVDCLVVDSAHGHSLGVLETIQKLHKLFPATPIVGGNVGTLEGATALVQAGAAIVKIGIGPGSICTTRIVSGVGVPQFTAVYEISRTLREKFPHVGVIADGGIRYSGDVTKALAAGAHAVMLGSLFAGTDESPGEMILYQGRSYKSYRGMGSLGAMKLGGKSRYFQGNVKEASKLVPEGVEARVPYRGKLSQVVYQLVGGLRAGMGYVGAEDLDQLVAKARFRKISSGALKESHVHDVQITAESPNYSGGGGTDP
jgi:IMP dehydrogenase